MCFTANITGVHAHLARCPIFLLPQSGDRNEVFGKKHNFEQENTIAGVTLGIAPANPTPSRTRVQILIAG
jgi:hypothetical protein